jgi:hypothetical protein
MQVNRPPRAGNASAIDAAAELVEQTNAGLTAMQWLDWWERMDLPLGQWPVLTSKLTQAMQSDLAWLIEAIEQANPN